MSYHRKTLTRMTLGATLSPGAATTAAQQAAAAKSLTQTAGSSVTPILALAAALSADPSLPQVACLAGQLNAIENHQPVPVCGNFPLANRPGGIGLREAVPAMRAWVYVKQNPWVKPVAVATVLGIPFLLGFLLGGRKRA